MTLPNEELNALKKSHKFLVQQCLWKTPLSMLWIILSGQFEKWRQECYWCIRHFPYDCKLDRLYSSEVCSACGDTRDFCKCEKEDN